MFIYPLFLFAIGLCLGSFVNMLVYRVEEAYGLKNSKSVNQWISGSGNNKKNKANNLAQMLKNFQHDVNKLLGGRSYCDYCKKQLHWYENVPVVSWLLQGGKTRCCGKKLPWQYPMVELGMGGLLALNFQFFHLRQGFGGRAIFNINLDYLLLVFSSLILVFIVFSFVFDLKHMILPDFSTAILIILGIIYVLLFNYVDWKNYLLGGLLGVGVIGGLYWITKGRAMGFGDVKLAVFIGMFLGVKNLIIALYVAFITGAVVGVYLLITGKKKARSPIPFGPFLLLGTLVAWWFGAKIWYEAWLYFG